jgi:hypothetical protein
MTVPDVSLVIVCHDMRRELARTLLSLATPWQHGCPRGRCEIIVVDNGSVTPPSTEEFAALDADIRVLHQPVPTASPAAAINTGLAAARAALIGVWIDGARLASPGLVSSCMRAAQLHPRPVIATLNYQLGPSLQYDSDANGYDRTREDALLAEIDWPRHGYRLFDVSTSELRHGEAGPMLESNALFLPRRLWRELGGYDTAFTEPGGGAVNPDTFIRACRLPDVQLIRVLGEGTFHQLHGGLSTSTRDGAIRVVKLGSRAYLRRRGTPLTPVREPGWLYDARSGVVREHRPTRAGASL